MPPIAFPTARYTLAARFRPATRAVRVTIARLACSVALLQACNAGDAVAPLDPAAASSTSQIVGSATVGSQLDAPVRVSVTRSDGRPLAGAPVNWTARDGGSVSVASSVTDANGIATVRWTLGTVAGPQSLLAEVFGLTPIVFGANAVADRPVSLRFTQDEAQTRLIGDTIRLHTIALDRFGNTVVALPALSVESANDVAILNGSLLLARRRGVAVVRATLGSVSGRLTVVVDPLVPAIASVSPDTLVPGGMVTITGANFALLADAAEVSVGGIRATITRVSPTRIDAQLPLDGFGCQATASKAVRVTIADSSAQAAVALRTATRVSLARGQSANILDASQVRCTEIVPPAGAARAKYVVAVINTSGAASATSGFELRGSGGGAMLGKVATPMTGAAIVTSAAPVARKPLPAALLEAQRGDRAHATHLEAQRATQGRYGSPAPAWSTIRAGGMRSASLRMATSVGDTVMMKALYSTCSRGADIRARVVYAGARSVVLEDVTAPRAGQMDEQYRAIGEDFDLVQYPLLQAKVGDPLAMNAAMQGDGRVTMLFTRYVNDSLPGIAGFVTACNFYPKSTFAASNEDEVFYARVAHATESPDEWRRGMRSTVVHEAKHLASFAERMTRGTTFEESWLEESTARIAEELYSRTFAEGGAWKSNVGYSTVRCEVTRCDSRPLMMWRHFSVLHQYLRGVDTLTPIGAAASGDFTYYASGWSLVRWAADQYAGDESQWLKALVKGGAHTGLANLAQRTGHPAEEMLADWALAHAVDDLPGFTPARAQLSFPSWNMPNVMDGLASSFPSVFVAAPLNARAMTFGSFSLPVARLRAFSSSYFSFEGPQSGSQVLELRGEGGVALPAGPLRVAIVRVE